MELNKKQILSDRQKCYSNRRVTFPNVIMSQNRSEKITSHGKRNSSELTIFSFKTKNLCQERRLNTRWKRLRDLNFSPFLLESACTLKNNVCLSKEI